MQIRGILLFKQISFPIIAPNGLEYTAALREGVYGTVVGACGKGPVHEADLCDLAGMGVVILAEGEKGFKGIDPLQIDGRSARSTAVFAVIQDGLKAQIGGNQRVAQAESLIQRPAGLDANCGGIVGKHCRNVRR